MDRHEYMSGICHSDDGHALLRHLLVCHIRRIAVAAICHDIQSARHQGFALVARHWSAPTAACRIRQVRNGAGACQTDEYVRLQHRAMEGFRRRLRRHLHPYALHRGPARDGFGAGLPHILPCSLPRGHARQHTLYGSCHGGILRCRHKVRERADVRHAHIGGQICRAHARADIHGVPGRRIYPAAQADPPDIGLQSGSYDCGNALLGVRHTLRRDAGPDSRMRCHSGVSAAQRTAHTTAPILPDIEFCRRIGSFLLLSRLRIEQCDGASPARAYQCAARTGRRPGWSRLQCAPE